MNRENLPAPNMICEVCGRKYRRCNKCYELKNRGIEAWREHCDSIECYQTLLFVNSDDYSKLTKEEYDRVIAFELPDGRDPVESIQNKLDEIKAVIESKEKDDNLVSNAQSVQSVQSVQSIQKVQNVQNGNQWKNNKNNKSNKMYYPSGKNNSNKNVK